MSAEAKEDHRAETRRDKIATIIQLIRNGSETADEVAARVEALGYSRDEMSLRDWLAGKALAGILANDPSSNAVEWAPEHAYAMADAMLAARAKNGGAK